VGYIGHFVKAAVKNGANFRLARLNRILAWFTLPLLVFFVLCGYGSTNPGIVGGLTGGLLTRTLSINLHTLLAPAVLILLLVHMLIGLRFALLRLRVQDGKLLNGFILALGIFFMMTIVVFQTLSV
jgi:hypothetical protein